MDVAWSAVVFILLGAVICSAEQGIWSVLQSYPRVELQNRTVHLYNERSACTQPGLQCTSCNRLSLCVATSSGFSELYTEDCDSQLGEYCSVSLKECTGRKSYCSLNAKFECQDDGIFPDPFDCNQYYICSLSPSGGLTAEKVVCPAGKAFNAKTFQCDLSDNNAVCNGYPVPECGKSGLSSGPLPQNPNLYYICKGGLPQLFKCLNGDDYVYDPDLYACVRKEPEPTTTTTTTTTTTEEPELCVPDEYTLVPHTCRFAYMCKNVPNHGLSLGCGTDRYFSPETKWCADGPAPFECDWNLACPTKELHPVSKSCRMYYVCTSETEEVRTCAGYFNRETLKCGKGNCPYKDHQLI